MLPFKGARGRRRVGCSWSAPPASASAAAAPPAIAGSDGRAGRWPQFRCRLGHSLPSPTKALRNSAPGSCHTAPRRSSRIAQTHGDAVPAIRGPSGSGAAHPDHPLRPHLHHGGVVGRGSWADSAREEFGHARMGGMTAPASAGAMDPGRSHRPPAPPRTRCPLYCYPDLRLRVTSRGGGRTRAVPRHSLPSGCRRIAREIFPSRTIDARCEFGMMRAHEVRGLFHRFRSTFESLQRVDGSVGSA